MRQSTCSTVPKRSSEDMPIDAQPQCRVTIIAFSDASRDGRTLNICRTVAPIAGVTLWNIASQPDSVPWKWQAVKLPQRRRMLWRWVHFVGAVLRGNWGQRSDVFWAADVYSLLPCVLLRWFSRNAHVIYDSRELYSSLGSLAHRRLAQRLLALYERVLVRWVDRVVVSGERDARVLERLLPLDHSPTVILNVPFYAEPVRSDRLRERCGIPASEPIVLYQGAVLEGRGLHKAIEVLEYLPRVHLCILGDGEALPALVNDAARRAVRGRVHLLGSVPYDELLQWTASADIGWCWIEPISESYQLALPNKLFEYAMARIPVIASQLPAIADVLERFPFGVCVSTAATAAEIAAAIERLLAAADEYRHWAAVAAREFCYERQQRVIESLIARCCNA